MMGFIVAIMSLNMEIIHLKNYGHTGSEEDSLLDPSAGVGRICIRQVVWPEAPRSFVRRA